MEHRPRLTGDASVAEDIAAEALARRYARWSRVRSYEYRDAWVARVATNLVLDAAKKRKPSFEVAVTDDPSETTVLRVALVDALQRLPRRRREAVALRLADMTIDDVARTLGVSGGTVKQQVHRALEKLRGQLGTDTHFVAQETLA